MGNSRKTALKGVRRVVVKVGSGVISSRDHGLRPDRIASVVGQVARMIENGLEVVLVSSGAVAAGASVLGIRELASIPVRQAAAAAGQSRLIWAYEEHFQKNELKVAQVLLTQDDVANRHRFLNARNTFAALLGFGIVPIVNENDSVVVEEIKFGDNDTLSGLVATVVDADLLLLLSDVDGLYTKDPGKHPDATRINEVREVTPDIRKMADGPGSREGTGGMITKLGTAEKLSATGIPTLLVDGTGENTALSALAGEDVGTLFHATGTTGRKKHWLAHIARCEGTLHLDAGARDAIQSGKKSLLPSGISKVTGSFEMGAGVALVGPDGDEVARGLSNYAAVDIDRIRGRHSSEIQDILGIKAYDEVVHRDNLVVTR
ncbi:MAG: glutamate 5-kinase [Leptospirillia bacterium]